MFLLCNFTCVFAQPKCKYSAKSMIWGSCSVQICTVGRTAEMWALPVDGKATVCHNRCMRPIRLFLTLALLSSTCAGVRSNTAPPVGPSVLVLDGPVDAAMARKTRKYLDNVRDSPVLVALDSTGGSVGYGLQIFAMLRADTRRTDCVVPRQAASAAAMILQACDNRLMYPRAVLGIHRPQQPLADGGYVAILPSEDAAAALLVGLSLFRSDMTTSDFERLTEGDRPILMDAETAVAAGFADEIAGQ